MFVASIDQFSKERKEKNRSSKSFGQSVDWHSSASACKLKRRRNEEYQEEEEEEEEEKEEGLPDGVRQIVIPKQIGGGLFAVASFYA